RAPLSAALNSHGDMAWSPALADDISIKASFNAHQLTDKGLGPAAGPDAANVAAHIFERHGFLVSTADSPWVLGAEHVALHDELLGGIAKAAAEAGHAGAGDWLEQRRATLSASAVRIGHTDILAVPH
ncbi:MAG: class I SAM-dependent methyltransferase, partial [Pseudomonadota bacterium]